MYENHKPAHHQQEQKQNESKQPDGRQHPRLVCWFLGGLAFGAIFQCLNIFSSIQQGTSNKTAGAFILFETLFYVGYVLHLSKQVKYHRVLQLDLCHIMVCLDCGFFLGTIVSLSMIQDILLHHQGFPILGILTADCIICYGSFWIALQYQRLHSPLDEAAEEKDSDSVI
jgi:hypothetical protein